METKTVLITHPLRDIVYQLKEPSFPSPIEVRALEAYRRAHDEAWRMKLRFEKEKGEVLLACIDLEKFNAQLEEFEDIRDHYLRQADFSDAVAAANMDIRLQVEMRDFYNQVGQLQKTLVKFYDRIDPLKQAYTDIMDSYFRGEKPLDPVQFKVLDDVFRFHDDMQVTITSLDKDLQGFLQVLTDIYAFLEDEYIPHYSVLDSAYGVALHRSVDLVKSVQVFNNVWE
ncbi:hypothetical protein [Parapedobacter sp. 10938]|uniref:hypothetical protein n=1 Tax=Parapedobacter flavus TaxID=3110225 RepID=UPI002DBAD98A|nr:hypothetical protein [Parapedobacter sp. 10938]MEC3880882.1 hypothetical protein [Parapedobacter sp. 10938]